MRGPARRRAACPAAEATPEAAVGPSGVARQACRRGWPRRRSRPSGGLLIEALSCCREPSNRSALAADGSAAASVSARNVGSDRGGDLSVVVSIGTSEHFTINSPHGKRWTCTEVFGNEEVDLHGGFRSRQVDLRGGFPISRDSRIGQWPTGNRPNRRIAVDVRSPPNKMVTNSLLNK